MHTGVMPMLDDDPVSLRVVERQVDEGPGPGSFRPVEGRLRVPDFGEVRPHPPEPPSARRRRRFQLRKVLKREGEVEVVVPGDEAAMPPGSQKRTVREPPAVSVNPE